MEMFIKRLKEEKILIDNIVKELSKETDDTLQSISDRIQLIYSTPFRQTEEATNALNDLKEKFAKILKDKLSETPYNFRQSSDLMIYYSDVLVGYYNFEHLGVYSAKDVLHYRHLKKNNFKNLLRQKKEIEDKIDAIKQQVKSNQTQSKIFGFEKNNKLAPTEEPEELSVLKKQLKFLNEEYHNEKEKSMDEVNKLTNFEEHTLLLKEAFSEIEDVYIAERLLLNQFYLRLFRQTKPESVDNYSSDFFYREDDLFAIDMSIGHDAYDIINQYNLETISINTEFLEKLLQPESRVEFELEEAVFIDEDLNKKVIKKAEEIEKLKDPNNYYAFSSAVLTCIDHVSNKVYKVKMKDSGDLEITGEFVDIINILSYSPLKELVRD